MPNPANDSHLYIPQKLSKSDLEKIDYLVGIYGVDVICQGMAEILSQYSGKARIESIVAKNVKALKDCANIILENMDYVLANAPDLS